MVTVPFSGRFRLRTCTLGPAMDPCAWAKLPLNGAVTTSVRPTRPARDQNLPGSPTLYTQTIIAQEGEPGYEAS